MLSLLFIIMQPLLHFVVIARNLLSVSLESELAGGVSHPLT